MKAPAPHGGAPSRRSQVPVWRSWLTGAALLATCLVAGACGVPYGSAPQSLSEPLPAQLTSPNEAAPTTTLPATGHGAVADFYYVESSLLKQFPQAVPRPVTLSEILQTLESGPSIAVAGSGGIVTTDLPIGSNLSALGIVDGVARVGLDLAYYELGLQQEVLELGQIVYSLIGTDALGIKAVQFFYNGSPVVAVNGSGETVTGTVTEASYCVEATGGCPLPASTTTKHHKKKAKRAAG